MTLVLDHRFLILWIPFDTEQSLKPIKFKILQYVLLWVSSPDNVGVTDKAWITKNFKVLPKFLCLNVITSLEGTLSDLICHL